MIKGDNFMSKSKITLLWIHECQRVFSDRCTNEKDLDIFINFIKKTENFEEITLYSWVGWRMVKNLTG